MPLAIGDRVRELGSQYHGTIVDLPNANQASVVWDGARGASTRASLSQLAVVPAQLTCIHCKQPIRETRMGHVRNEYEHMDGMSMCNKGKGVWAWPEEYNDVA